ncbi:GNAT family N-acetyltransferase [Candidatus Gracilibacteria bacterium]|nr:GNAT family N-acetyltransferase [Candidatus Gracilibacteria bacterium]
MPELVLPSEEYRDSFLEALAEIKRNPIEASVYHKELEVSEGTFAAYLKRLAADSRGEGLRPEQVPQTQYWIVEGREYLGRVNIRHWLNDVLSSPGGFGHIGAIIRPSARGNGIAGVVLAQSLLRARELGLREVVLSANQENVPSWRTIERGGGRLVAINELSPGSFERRYVIRLEE